MRSVAYAGDGLRVNGERIYIQGVNQHHDFGSLGAAFNVKVAELGCNSVRKSHNPPARELLDLANELGILILDEIFDTWRGAKVVNDFSLIFNEWYEADLRNFIRRGRNHLSVVLRSYGNEVVEQRKACRSNGHALVVIHAKAGASGPLTVTASAKGLKGAEVTL